MRPGRGTAPAPAPRTPRPPSRPPGAPASVPVPSTTQPANRAEASLASSLIHLVSQVRGTWWVSPHWAWAGTGPRATQGRLASRTPREGGTGGGGSLRTRTGVGRDSAGRREWLRGRRAPHRRPSLPLPADLVQQRVQHADAEDTASGERQAEHEGQVGAVLPLPLRERAAQRGRGPRPRGTCMCRHVREVCTCVWCVACTCVHEYMHQQLSTRLRVPTGHTGAPAREQRDGGLWGEGGPGTRDPGQSPRAPRGNALCDHPAILSDLSDSVLRGLGAGALLDAERRPRRGSPARLPFTPFTP